MSSKHQTTNFIPGAKYNYILVKKNIFEPVLEMLTALNESQQGLFENLKEFMEDPSFETDKKQSASFEEKMMSAICETYDLGSDLRCYSSDSPIALMISWLISEISSDMGESMKVYMKKPYLLYSAHPHVKFTIQDMQNFSKNMKKIFLRYLDKNKYKEVVKLTRKYPCLEDFTDWDSFRKTDAYRKLYHTRVKVKNASAKTKGNDENGTTENKETNGGDISLDSLIKEHGEGVLGTYDTSEFLISSVFVKDFLLQLEEKDRKIISLRMQDATTQEIADRLGYKTHSAVVKRLDKIAEKYKAYAKEDF